MIRATLLTSGAALILAAMFLGPLDNAITYVHFRTLTKAKLEHGARSYIRDGLDRHQMACLYVVACDGETARLELVQDPDAWDLKAAKQTIWRRRFQDFCPGRTTNIGLRLIPMEDARPLPESNALARWSFFNDRFIPRQSRFQTGAFSDAPWEDCTAEKALRF